MDRSPQSFRTLGGCARRQSGPGKSRRRRGFLSRRLPASAGRRYRRGGLSTSSWFLGAGIAALWLAVLYLPYLGTIEPKTVEARVRAEFADAPIMVKIAWCESRFRQLDDDGSVHRGRVNPKDAGVFQINEPWHLHTASRLGMNIRTLDGNIAYARYLYDKNGTRDWKWSRRCWGR